MPFYSPLRYPGGKNCIFEFVANLFHENDLYGASYAEPYAGGAGLALRLLFEEYVENIYINDFDRSIFAFWSAVIENTDKFCQWLQDVDISLASWHHYKKIQQNKDSVDIFSLAKSTFFLNRTNVSGIIKGGIIGGFQQRGKYKIDARFKKDALIARIQKIAKFKSRITVSNLDGLVFVRNLNKSKENVFIYLDPPYYQKGADLYMNAYSEKDHQALSQYVHKIEKKWMLSYDNHEFILNLYKKENKFIYKLFQSTSNRVGDEVLFFSNGLSFNQSMSRLNDSVII